MKCVRNGLEGGTKDEVRFFCDCEYDFAALETDIGGHCVPIFVFVSLVQKVREKIIVCYWVKKFKSGRMEELFVKIISRLGN